MVNRLNTLICKEFLKRDYNDNLHSFRVCKIYIKLANLSLPQSCTSQVFIYLFISFFLPSFLLSFLAVTQVCAVFSHGSFLVSLHPTIVLAKKSWPMERILRDSCHGLLGYNTLTSPWRWRQHGPPKRWYLTTSLHGVITQKTTTWIFTAV
jgi:hypothetical protein